MMNVNKISIFDQCVDGQYPNFKELINPMFDVFNRFYKTYKEVFVGSTDNVKAISFNIEENNTASFDVVCDGMDIDIEVKDRGIEVVRVENGYHFNIQSNK